ncbi:MAG TPA: DUF2203 domain-containing protein [Actinomycetota bacterium]|nr:DUF2203 domain-containing protein [Actinomycetota bacterium]
MTEERIFTIEEASAELPELRARLPRLREARRALIDASRRIDEAVAVDGGGIEGSDWFRAQTVLREELEFVVSRGVVIRDLDAGLVDFPATRDGDDVFLCWRIGEPTIAWFHGRRSGYSGRRPL